MMQSLTLKNLDDVVRFMKENLPKWTVKRGKTTCIREENKDHALDYEVVQIFPPNDNGQFAFAEFWRGYYSFAPNDYTAFCGGEYGIYHIIGDLSYIMKDVLEYNEALENVPKILESIRKAAEKDPVLKKVYVELYASEIRKQRNGDTTNTWYADCSRFNCEDKQICRVRVNNLENHEYTVSYRILKEKGQWAGFKVVSEGNILVNVE